jgi:hypothetical protein
MSGRATVGIVPIISESDTFTMAKSWIAYVFLVFELQVITGFHSQSAWNSKAPMRDIKTCEFRCLLSKNWCQNTQAVQEISQMPRRDLMFHAATLGSLLLSPQIVFADMTLETFKRAYYRYVPRIEAGT